LNFHSEKNFETIKPPPRLAGGDIPIVAKLNEVYVIWHGYLNDLPRLTRYTLGIKIDNILTDMIELLLTAEYLRGKEKLPILQQFSNKLDTLKYFIIILWQVKGINESKNAVISDKLKQIGRMLGQWLKIFPKETPPNLTGGE